MDQEKKLNFDNISQGNFEANGNAVHDTQIGHCIHISNDENRYANAEFIAFCFNLQQKYDLSMFEQILDTCELANKALEVYKIPMNFQSIIDKAKKIY